MDGRESRAGSARSGMDARSQVSLPGMRVRSFLRFSWLAVFLCLAALVAQATTSYVYDANGRLVAVSKDDGSSAQYTYDAVGNLVQVSAVPSGQLALFAFTPTHGTVGTAVTLYGQGFDTTAANNSVGFNGTAAAVTAATANQLQVQVPAGATTGPITVSVGTRTATSAQPFTVDDTGLPPVISLVTPVTVAVGDSVTVSGAHLLPLPQATDLRLGGYPAAIGATSTSAQLNFIVPVTSSSGHVTVQTPYGQATSTETVLVLPAGVSAASVVSRGYATIDSAPANLTIAAAGQIGALLFDASGGNWVSLQASNLVTSASSINYKVYGPGNVLVQSGAISAGAPSIHLPRLSRGTYLATFQPDSAGAQLSVAIESNATLTVDTLATVATTSPGQSKRVLFNAGAGQSRAFYVAGTTSSPAGSSIVYTIYTPSGASYTGATIASSGLVNLGNLPSTGTYQLVMAPGSTATASAQLKIASGAGGEFPPSGSSQSVDASVPGQNAYLSFVAPQGGSYELTLSNVKITGASGSDYVLIVNNPSGSLYASTTCYTTNPSGNCSLHLWYLPAGRYTITVVPTNGGTLHFNALLAPPLAGPDMTPGTTSSIALGNGQWEQLTFHANGGDTVALQVSAAATTPAGWSVQFLVYAPTVGAITTSTPYYTSLTVNGSQTVNLPNLPATGTYTVVVNSSYNLPANAQFSLVPGATGQTPSDGTPQTFDANTPGQNVYFNFTAQQGDSYLLTLANVRATGASGSNYSVIVNNPSGSLYTSATCYTTYPAGNCDIRLWYLPPGKYTVTVLPSNGGTLHFNASLAPATVGPDLSSGQTANLTFGAGQWSRLTFQANAGDAVGLQVTGSTGAYGQPVRFWVYRPDVGAITTSTPVYTTFDASGTQLVNLPNLPVSGKYTVIAEPYYALPGSAQFTVVAGASGAVPPDGTAQAFDANAAGQNVYFSLTAQQGDSYLLTLSNAQASGSSGSNYSVIVNNPSGSQYTSATCYTTSPAGNCDIRLWYLPPGKYTVTVLPSSGGTLHFNASLTPATPGPDLTVGQTANLSFGMGQWSRLTFQANAGDTAGLLVTASTGSYGQPVRFWVYRPDVGAITTSTAAYTTFDVTGTQLINLPGLPASGKYTVIAEPYYALPGTAQFGLVSGVSRALPLDGTSQSVDANAPGQNAYFSITAQAGDSYLLTLANASAAGSSGTGYSVIVNNPSGSQYTSASCSTSSPGGNCDIRLWYLPAGTYSVAVVPNNGGTLHFNASLAPATAGPDLTVGQAANLTFGTGQWSRLTFQASAGDTVGLQVTAGTGSYGQPVRFWVYRPDAGAITASTSVYATFDVNGTQSVNLANLPVGGRYTVVAEPFYGLSGTAQLSFASDTSGQPPVYDGGAITADGQPHAYTAQASGQSVSFKFNAALGDNLELMFSDVGVAGGASNGFTATVYAPGGAQVGSINCYASSGPSCRFPQWNLVAGSYSVAVSPLSGGTVSFKAILQPDVVGSALALNTPASFSLGAGQVQRMTLHANAGDTVAVQLSGVSTTPAGQTVYANIYRPDAGLIVPGNYYTQVSATGSAIVNLPGLPVTGDYAVVLFTANGMPASAQLTVLSGSTGTLPLTGAEQRFDASAADQNVYLSFDANRGDNLELAFKDVSDGGVAVSVYTPSGAQLDSFTCAGSTGPSCRSSEWNLAPGTYKVVVTPGAPGKQPGFKALIQPDTIGAALVLNTPAPIGLGLGQVQRVSFHAGAGDTVALQLSGVSSTPGGQAVYAAIYRPDLGLVSRSNQYTQLSTASTNIINLPSLPATGDYTVVLFTASGAPANAQVTAFSGSVGALPVTGLGQRFDASAADQNVYLSFDAQLGDNLELTFSDVSDGGLSFSIYTPSGAQLDSGMCSSSTGPSCRLSEWNLPQGTYRVIAVPGVAGKKLGFSALVQPDTVGPALAMNTATPVSLGVGQVQRLTFHANLGDTVALQLSGVATTPTGQTVYARIYRPDVGLPGPSNNYTLLSTTASNIINLPNLPVTGDYLVELFTTSGAPANAQLTLFPGTVGSLPATGLGQRYDAPVEGQNVYLTFDANRADNLELTFSDVSEGGLSASVFAPDGTQTDNINCNTSTGASCRSFQWNRLPGTYTVVVTGVSNKKLGFKALIQPDTIGPAVTLNTPTPIGLGLGQVQRVTFHGNAGDALALQLSGVVVTPSGQNVYGRIYRPDTGVPGLTNYYGEVAASTSSTTNLARLPASGDYLIVFFTVSGAPANLQLTVIR